MKEQPKHSKAASRVLRLLMPFEKLWPKAMIALGLTVSLAGVGWATLHRVPQTERLLARNSSLFALEEMAQELGGSVSEEELQALQDLAKETSKSLFTNRASGEAFIDRIRRQLKTDGWAIERLPENLFESETANPFPVDRYRFEYASRIDTKNAQSEHERERDVFADFIALVESIVADPRAAEIESFDLTATDGSMTNATVVLKLNFANEHEKAPE